MKKSFKLVIVLVALLIVSQFPSATFGLGSTNVMLEEEGFIRAISNDSFKPGCNIQSSVENIRELDRYLSNKKEIRYFRINNNEIDEVDIDVLVVKPMESVTVGIEGLMPGRPVFVSENSSLLVNVGIAQMPQDLGCEIINTTFEDRNWRAYRVDVSYYHNAQLHNPKTDFLCILKLSNTSNDPISVNVPFMANIDDIPDDSLYGYTVANGEDESRLGKECNPFLEAIKGKESPFWVNTVNLNYIHQTQVYSLPVKGSALSMDFFLTYNSQSYIDTGVGWGWVHNYQVRCMEDAGSDDLLMRTASGTVTRFIPTTSVPPNISWEAKYGHLKATKFYDGVDQVYKIEMVHTDGSKILFMEVNYEYIPIKYTDPHGRFFYLVYDTFGRLVEVKNDYTSRSLLFSYTIGNRLQYVIDTTPDQTEFEIIYTTRLHPETLEDIYVLSNMTIEQESFWGAVYKYTDKGEQKGFESPLEWFIMYQKENSIQYPPIPDVQYDNGVVYKVYNPVSNADGIEETLQWTYLLPHDNEYECGRESFFEGYTTRVDNWNPEQPSSVPEPKIDTVGMYRCLMYYHEPITGYLVSVYKDRDSEDPGPENCGQGGDVWLDDCCKTELVTYGYTSKGDVSNQKYLGQETGTDYTYDYEVPGSTATGQVVKVEENVGNANATRPTSEFAYSPDGTLSTSTNPAGAVTTYDYYTDKRQKSVTGQSGETRTIEYDSDGQVIKAKSPGCDEGDSDIETTIDYKTNGLVQSVTEPNGKSTSYDYDQKYRIQRIFENGNLLTEFEYDNRGRINKITQNTSGTSEQWSYQYDYKGRVSSSTYTHGTETQVTSYEYYGNDKVKKITDSNNEITEFRYNIDGKLVKVINPDSGEETWEYDRLGRVISNTSPEGVEVEYSYNDNGKLYQFTKVKGDDGTNDYTFTFEYDDLLRPTKITKPDSSYTQRTYKNETNLVSAERDELGNISEYSYDTSGRLSSSEDAEGHTLDYYYNDCGTIKQVTDGSGNSYKYEYDSAGRLNKVTDALNNSWEYTFDTDSNDLVYKTDSQNRTIQYSWND
ncbi:MAG TPA: hypothetical protein PKV16_09140 [Caldisericia bacterium]|nr:hypothetical protein [Caldisericia bacterium]HPI84660.1 hypothetical protein [Caldisericia bacterium]HPQ93925.1 hypothetical protein [Caldisericia bacterium]